MTGRLVIALVCMLISGLLLSATYMYQTTGELRRTLVHVEAQRIVSGVTEQTDLTTLPLKLGTDTVEYTLYSANGEVIWYSKNLTKPLKLKPNILASNWYFHLFKDLGRRIGVPITLKDDNIIVVSVHDQQTRKLLEPLIEQRVKRIILLVIPLSILLSLIVLPLLVRWILSSIKTASAVALKIQPLGDVQKIPVNGLPTEIKPLADAANRALAKLELAFEAERRFVADAAHELRTPLAVISLQLNNLKQQQTQDYSLVQNEIERLQQLVSQLLQLARLEHDGEQTREVQSSQVSRVLRKAVAALLPQFERKNKIINVTVEEKAEYKYCIGSEHHLYEVFINLLENALIHGDGQVDVLLTLQQTHILVVIADQGQGLVGVTREQLCQRFFKLNHKDTGGSGLGLAIVKGILDSMNGQLTLYSKPNTQFTISLTKFNG